MGCFVRGGKNGMGCFVRGDKNCMGCFVWGGKLMRDVLSGVAKNGMGCFVPGCFVLHSSLLAWSLCDFLGDPDQYCLETLNFCDFSGGGGWWSGPPAPSGSAHNNQCSVLKVLCQTCGNIGDIMSKKYAEEKSKRTRFCIY